MPAERSCIARAADELDSAHHVLVKAIAVHLADGGTWESAFDEWTNAAGHFVNRLGIHSAMTFRRRFGLWVTSYEHEAGAADGAGASRKETR